MPFSQESFEPSSVEIKVKKKCNDKRETEKLTWAFGAGELQKKDTFNRDLK